MRLKLSLLLFLLFASISARGQGKDFISEEVMMSPYSAEKVTFLSNANMTFNLEGESDIRTNERLIFQILFDDNLSLWESQELHVVYAEVLLAAAFDVSFELIAPANTTIHFLFLNFYNKVVLLTYKFVVLEIHTEETPFLNLVQVVLSISLMTLLYRKKIQNTC